MALKKEKEQAKKRTKSTNSTSTVNASNMGNFDIIGQIDTSNYHEPSDNNTTDGMDALKITSEQEVKWRMEEKRDRCSSDKNWNSKALRKNGRNFCPRRYNDQRIRGITSN